MDKKKNVRMGMAKAVADAGDVKAATTKKVSDVEWLKAQGKAVITPPKSDMQNVYDKVIERFDAEDIAVNTKDMNRVEIGKDFVKDCSAMISERMSTPPEYAPFNVEAKLTCVVVKGNDTGLRLDLLKQAVRNALMKEPLDFGTFLVSTVVTDEADSKVIGFRQSVMTLSMQAERKIKSRW